MGNFYFEGKLLNAGNAVIPGSEKILRLKSLWESGEKIFHLQTSGSTGAPRKMNFTRDQLIASANSTINYFGLKKGSRLFCPLSIDHVAGFMMVIRGLVSGADVYFTRPAKIPFPGTPPPVDYDFAPFVPLQIAAIMEDKKYLRALNRIKIIILGGSAISGNLAQKVKTLEPAVYHTYGMTETLTHVAVKRLNGKEEDPWFHALPGVTFSVDNEGRLIISASHLGVEVKTNDLATLSDNKTFRIEGRYDDVIITGGIKVHPEKVRREVEKVFARLNASIPHLLITSKENEKYGQAVILTYEGEKISDDFFRDLKENLKRGLSSHELPKEFINIAEFPLLPSGKPDKIRIRELVNKKEN